MPTSRSRAVARPALAAAAGVLALALAGCGSDGLMHDGAVGMKYDGHTASTTQLQTAAKQITTALGSGTISPADVASVLSLQPEAIKLGRQHNVVVSADQIRSAYPKATLSDTAVQALRSNQVLSTLQNNGDLTTADLQKMLKASKVQVNPRYGTWVSGKGVQTASQPWVSATPSSSTATTPSNGRAAE